MTLYSAYMIVVHAVNLHPFPDKDTICYMSPKTRVIALGFSYIVCCYLCIDNDSRIETILPFVKYAKYMCVTANLFPYIMMTSSNGNIFRVTGPLCGEFTGLRWNPHTKGQWRGALMFSLNNAWTNAWVNNREAGDLRRYRVHFDVTVMIIWKIAVSKALGWLHCRFVSIDITKLSSATIMNAVFL